MCRSHNDQSRIIATTNSLPNNYVSVRGASNSTFAQDRGSSVSNLVGSLRECVCVCCVECDPPQTGVNVWGGLRRPFGPFQVTCVLAAAVLAAGFSICAALAQRRPKTGSRHVSWQAGQNLYIVILRTTDRPCSAFWVVAAQSAASTTRLCRSRTGSMRRCK